MATSSQHRQISRRQSFPPFCPDSYTASPQLELSNVPPTERTELAVELRRDAGLRLLCRLNSGRAPGDRARKLSTDLPAGEPNMVVSWWSCDLAIGVRSDADSVVDGCTKRSPVDHRRRNRALSRRGKVAGLGVQK